MKNSPGIETEPDRIIPVLSVSSMERDHELLQRILSRPECSEYTNARRTVRRSRTLASALSALEDDRIPLVVSECEVPPATWKDVLAQISLLSHASLLIVTSRHADDYLWAEVLNLGAWDVLAKPFDATEVIRVVGSAWLHWKDRHETNSARPRYRFSAGS